MQNLTISPSLLRNANLELSNISNIWLCEIHPFSFLLLRHQRTWSIFELQYLMLRKGSFLAIDSFCALIDFLFNLLTFISPKIKWHSISVLWKELKYQTHMLECYNAISARSSAWSQCNFYRWHLICFNLVHNL